jgi:hypothetical protein
MGDQTIYAFVQDVAAGWEQYQQVAASMLDPCPRGLILHVAGPTDEGFRTIAVWESVEAWEQFRSERLEPAIAALGGPFRPQSRFRDLRPAHIVAGDVGLAAGGVWARLPAR